MVSGRLFFYVVYASAAVSLTFYILHIWQELLALGERMGTVSTALSEEELLKCVRRSVYQVTTSEVRFTGSGEDEDDIKCSICQVIYFHK